MASNLGVFTATAVASFLWAAPACAQKVGKAEAEAIAWSARDASAFVSVQNDPLDVDIRLSTEPFYQMKQGPLKMVNADKFVRAWINKKTGETRFQVYIYVYYGGSGWQTYNRATYETKSGPEEVSLDRITSDVTGCSRYGCTHREDFGFSVPENVLRWAANGAAAGSGEEWHFRLYSQAGAAETTGLLKTEIAGLLMRVDQERDFLIPPNLKK